LFTALTLTLTPGARRLFTALTLTLTPGARRLFTAHGQEVRRMEQLWDGMGLVVTQGEDFKALS
jgi:hypothetical protein